LIFIDETSTTSSAGVPSSKLKKAGFFFAFGDEPPFIDAARIFASLAKKKQFQHIAIFTDKDCTKEKYLSILNSIGTYMEEGGLCWICISTHGELDNTSSSKNSKISFFDDEILTTQDLRTAIEKIVANVRLLLVFNACQSNHIPYFEIVRRLFTQLWLPEQRFSFPGQSIFTSDNWAQPTTAPVNPPPTPQVIAFGVDGFATSDCASFRRSCFATEFVNAIALHPSPQFTYDDLFAELNKNPPHDIRWAFTKNNSTNANPFLNQFPLS
jgi:hypothetical protein